MDFSVVAVFHYNNYRNSVEHDDEKRLRRRRSNEFRKDKDKGKEKEIFGEIEAYIHRLAKVNNITYAAIDAPVPPKSATAVVSTSKLIVPLADLIDLEAEVKRQEKKLEKLTNEKNSLMGRMKNEKFVANAKPEIVEMERKKQADAESKIKSLTENLNKLK